jgi:hypothetical protein
MVTCVSVPDAAALAELPMHALGQRVSDHHIVVVEDDKALNVFAATTRSRHAEIRRRAHGLHAASPGAGQRSNAGIFAGSTGTTQL